MHVSILTILKWSWVMTLNQMMLDLTNLLHCHPNIANDVCWWICSTIRCISTKNFENWAEKIESITSNSRIIAVADTSENGNIGIFKPEDFLNHEEEEEAHEN